MRFIALLCAFTVAFSSVAFAASATPSNAVSASYSNAQIKDAQVGSDVLNPVLMSDGDDVQDVSNTIDLSSVIVQFYYYDMSNNLKYISADIDSDGTFIFSDRPSDCATPNRVDFTLTSASLPPSGKYQFYWHYGADVGGVSYTNLSYWLAYKASNVANQGQSYSGLSFDQFSGDASGTVTVDVGRLDTFSVQLYSKDFVFPFGGGFTGRFVPLSSDADVSLDSPGGSYTSTDAASDTAVNTGQIAENTSQIVSGQSAIMDTIREQIQYIIMQIESFWNQLAGEFTKMFASWDEDHQEQLQNDDKNTQDIIDNLGDNTTDIINNNNQNTQTITSGWDDSKLEQSGNQLNDSLTQYDDVESGIHDTASGWLDDYTLPDFDQLIAVPGVLSALTWLGTFMQTCFTNMGAFNIPVTLSLVLIFVLILVGYYRIRR